MELPSRVHAPRRIQPMRVKFPDISWRFYSQAMEHLVAWWIVISILVVPSHGWSRTWWGLTVVPTDIPASTTTVDLTGNDITVLPTQIFSHLGLLTHLYLNENDIHTIEAEAFEGLDSLVYLNLNHNPNIGVMPDLTSIADTLTSIHLHRNGMTSVPDGVFNTMTGLTQLQIGDNRLGAIPDISAVKGQLTHFWMPAIGITYLPQNAFRGMTSLHFLQLSWNGFGFIPNVPDIPPQLRTYRIAGIGIISIGSGDLLGLPDLTYLDLSYNEFNGIPDLTNVGTTVTHLSLRSIGVDAISSDAFVTMTVLVEVDLSYNPLTNIPSLPSLRASLTHLTFTHANKDGSGLIDYDPDALNNMTALTHLTLSSNQLSGSFSLPSAPNLQYLDLRKNNIDMLDPGFFAAVPAMTTMYAESNQLTELRPIPSGNNIQHLFLQNNDFTLFPDLNNFSSLEQIDLTSNGITSLPRDSVKHLNSGHIYLDSNPINCTENLCWLVRQTWPFSLNMTCSNGAEWSMFITMDYCGMTARHVWIFWDQDFSCNRLDNYQLGDTSTALWRDGDATSCMQVFPDNQNSFFARVLNPSENGFPRGVVVKVVGEHIACSPVGGVTVALQPSCNSDGTCPSWITCTAYVKTVQHGFTVCTSRCIYAGHWDYIGVKIIQAETHDYYNWKFCEIILLQ